MSAFETFSQHPESHVLGTPAQGMAQLLAAVADRATIHAGGKLVRAIDGPRQWLMVETSGSSGAPKTIRRSPQSWIASFAVNADLFRVTPADTYATLGPLAHSLTLYATLEALHLGADVLALAGQNPRNQAQHAADHRVTVIYATPAQLGLLLQGMRAAKITALPALRHIICGGGVLTETLRSQISQIFSTAQITQFFGASETSFITMSDAVTPMGSVGKPYPAVDLTAHAGEIWVRSPYLFDGYATGDASDTRWEGDALSIGEMGYLDAQGYLFLRGRKSRMVTVADHNVFPEEIEALISTLHICAVIPMPDPKRGHRIVCVLQGHAAPDFAALRQLCQARLGAHAVPKDFVMTDKIPMLLAGKPDTVTLTQWLKDRA